MTRGENLFNQIMFPYGCYCFLLILLALLTNEAAAAPNNFHTIPLSSFLHQSQQSNCNGRAPSSHANAALDPTTTISRPIKPQSQAFLSHLHPFHPSRFSREREREYGGLNGLNQGILQEDWEDVAWAWKLFQENDQEADSHEGLDHPKKNQVPAARRELKHTHTHIHVIVYLLCGEQCRFLGHGFRCFISCYPQR
ncbi:hypothetical protein DM860_018305 [Cuscuta australis]|uniref:Uncharacterized protein n=1 Tax=Cuscuta australis TaxID=267555 RepID=A0A328D9N4_9ASTE|nr:hypothetical protein DM860_018305 [Cuscuta australis]